MKDDKEQNIETGGHFSLKNWKSSRRRMTCSVPTLTHNAYTCKELTCSPNSRNSPNKICGCKRTHTFKRISKTLLRTMVRDPSSSVLCLFIIFTCNILLCVQAKSTNFQDELRNVIASPSVSEIRKTRSLDQESSLNVDTRMKRFSEDDNKDPTNEGDLFTYPSSEEINEDWAYTDSYEGTTYGDYDMFNFNDTHTELTGIINKLYLGPVCALVDVRNSPYNLKDLENCTVVNGFVQIIFMHNTKESDFEKYTFPKLRVITEYLLVYRVYGLRSLRKMFPNLSVIGGRRVFYKYGMVIYENPQLQELGLGNLRHIARGGVRIQKNNKLCYLDTVDWKRLGMLGNKVVNEDMANPVIKDNTVPGDETCLNQCGEDSDCISKGQDGDTQYCWGYTVCQKPSCPDECPNACMDTPKDQCQCHSECLAGCTAPHNASACLACLHKSNDGVCVPECPDGTFLENNWRCITREWCLQLTWVPHEGECLYQCPPDHIELEDNNGGFYCKYCGKKCREDCDKEDEYVVTDTESIKEIYGCTRIQGRLVINILGGDDLLKLLEEVLLGIEEVGALVIRRSESLVSLDLLRNLKRISGTKRALVDETYSLYVLDNQNLRELFPTRSNSQVAPRAKLNIEGGKAFFHFNPRLCVKEIDKISTLTSEVEDDKDISKTTNGDRATCDMMALNIVAIEHMPISDVGFATARVKWEKVAIGDPRTLIGYQVFYKESKYKNATRFEGLYACGKSSSWLIKDKLVSPHEASQEVKISSLTDAVLHNLKPFTQYALYVRTYTTSTAQKGAQSVISYFMTEPSKPSEPVDLSASSFNTTAIYVEWKPPISPNGNITHYIIRWRRQREDLDLIRSVDMCKSGKPTSLSKVSKPTDQPESSPTKTSSTENGKQFCSCDSKEILPSHEEEANNNLNFEKFLHKSIFKVHYIMADPDILFDSEKKKRSIDNDVIYRQRREDSEYNSTSNSSFWDYANEFFGSPDTTTMEDVVDTEYTWNFAVETKTHITLSSLHHFSEYEMQVYACNHASEQPTDIVYQFIKAGVSTVHDAGCSIESLTAKRCQRLPSADVIPPESFKLTEIRLDNEKTQPALRWDAPSDPNGYVKFYTIDIQQRTDTDFKSADERCFSLDKFILNHGIFTIPTTLAAGTYRGRVMAVTLAGKGQWTDFLTFDIPETVGVGPKAREKYVWIAAIVAVVIIALFVFLSLWYCRKKKQAEAQNAMIYSSANPEYVSLAANYIPDGYEIREDDVELLKLIGHGNFGKVFVGFAKKVIKGEEKTQVAIKKLHEKSGIHKRIEFLEEAKLMKAFNSTHVVRLLGVVSQTVDPMVIMEYMEKGDLKTHLRSRREDAEHDADWLPPPPLQEKLEMAAEIADGMAYLAEIKYVHRDLAARNCLVSAKGVVKIGDFGLTRDVYETDYYRKDSRGLLPIRWMAPESLRDGVFDSQSDVWSYGVVLWEIATLAEQPYQGLQHDHVTRYVIDGGYMEKPKSCPKKLYDLMLNCWEFNPEMRPKFTEMLSSLSNDVTERFRQESYYYEHKRAKLKKFADEDISLLNGDIMISREGSFRIATPINLTPSRSRSETPCGCHTPTSRNSNGSTKFGGEILPHCEHLKKNETSAFNLYTPYGKAGNIVHSPSIGNDLSRKGSGHLKKSDNRMGLRSASPHPKNTPPSTLSRRSDDFYYSLSTSGIEDDMGDESTEEDMTSLISTNDLKITNHINVQKSSPTPDRQNDHLFPISTNHISNNRSLENPEMSKSNGVDKPYAHMNGFVKRHNSQPRSKSPRRHSSRRTPVPDESSYVESSPKHTSSKFADVNSVLSNFHPLKVPPPPSAPPPFPAPNHPLLRS